VLVVGPIVRGLTTAITDIVCVKPEEPIGYLWSYFMHDSRTRNGVSEQMQRRERNYAHTISHSRLFSLVVLANGSNIYESNGTICCSRPACFVDCLFAYMFGLFS
jgi:hypothetical protein